MAARYDNFPVILETYRSCLKDVFDLPSLKEVLRRVEGRHIRVHAVRSPTPSPFASTLLFSYVAQFIYDGDAPVAERRAQVLSVDHAQLRELLGEAELRALFDQEVIDQTEARLQRLDARRVDHPDRLHDLLLELGDLRPDEIAARTREGIDPGALIRTLVEARRAIEVRVGGRAATRSRRGRGPPAGYAGGRAAAGATRRVSLEHPKDPWLDLVSRFARTHGPFAAKRVAERFGTGEAPVVAALERLVGQQRVVEGEFLPHGRGREWCDAEVLRTLKRISLARLRRQVEPVDQAALARFLVAWHGLDRRRRGLDGLLSVIEQLQGAPIPYSALETEILPARVEGYRPAMLDELCAAGEVVWRGLEPIGPHDGRVALYLSDRFGALAPPRGRAEGPRVDEVREVFARSGALFFADLSTKTGAFVHDLVFALWALVFAGELTNDTLQPLRALVATGSGASARRVPSRRTFRSRRLGPPGTEGRWSLLSDPRGRRGDRDRPPRGPRPATSRTPRGTHPRSRPCREPARRLFVGLRGAERDGRGGTRATRILRRGPRRDAVCLAGSGRTPPPSAGGAPRGVRTASGLGSSPRRTPPIRTEQPWRGPHRRGVARSEPRARKSFCTTDGCEDIWGGRSGPS